jgi:hypothetical protein
VYDQVNRTIWLNDQMWRAVRTAFPQLQRLPAEVLITVGYPSSGARGASQKLKPAEINFQWTGNPTEKAMILLHPVQLQGATPREQAERAIKALAFGGLKYVDGARWGAVRAGLTKNDDGTVSASPEAQAKIDAVIADVGEPPAGYGVPFPTRTVMQTRMRKYVCSTAKCSVQDSNGNDVKHPVIRAATDSGDFVCGTCGNPYVKA